MIALRTLTHIALVAVVLGWGPNTHAQDLPPIASPTTAIAVSSLPVVQSESQQITEFVTGLVQGLTTVEGIPAAAIAVVKEDHVDMVQGFGDGIDDTSELYIGTLSELFGALAAMQLIEQGRLTPQAEIGAVLGEDALRGVTLGALLSHEAIVAPDVLPAIIARASGMDFRAYVTTRILEPLAMRASTIDGEESRTSAADMSRLLLALVNGGSADGNQILLPQTVALLFQPHHVPHPAMPGWAYGFAQMQRNGWIALQRDGDRAVLPSAQARIVIVPEARLAYFVAIKGAASSVFWRTLDNALFDRLLAPKINPALQRETVDQHAEQNRAAAGSYRAQRNIRDSGVFLAAEGGPLVVGNGEGGALVVSGSETLTFPPAVGGIWRAKGSMIPAAIVGGDLQIDNIRYRRIPIWERAELYLLLGTISGLVAFAILVLGMRFCKFAGPARKTLHRIGAGLAGLAAIFYFLAIGLHRLA